MQKRNNSLHESTMLSKRALVGISICLITRYFFAVFGNTNFTRFNLHEEYTGLLCPTDSTLFTDSGLWKCLLQCVRSKGCYGVFLQPEQKFCVGCGKAYLSTYSDEMRYLNGTFYFRRRTFLLVSEERDWNESKSHCEDLGGYLADIKSKDEEDYILNYLMPINTDIWIGASDIKYEGVFQWRDGSAMSDYYFNWADNEPDTWLEDHDDHCVVLANRSSVVGWRDSYCGSNIASLCEFD